MTRLRALVYCCLSFALATLLHWLTWNMAFMHGSIVRGALCVDEGKDFWSALDAKIPVELNGYKFFPNTHEKKILVQKAKKHKGEN